MRFILRGRRGIWWGWRVMPVAPRIVSDVSYVMRINHEIPFAWQAQYLVRLEVDACCSAHCKWPFICDADQSWHSFCVAGAVFGEVGGRFLSLRALKMTFHMWCASIMRCILRGRRSIWWGCRVIPLAPRIENDVSYVMCINHEIHFAWQAPEYLEGVSGIAIQLQSSKHVSERAGGWFFSIGPSVLIGLCFFYRVETSAPGLSGYYWYINDTYLNRIWLLVDVLEN